VIVEDVSADPRYLACSLETRSEIVVPIRARGKIVGEIDIDSHMLNAFGADDRSFLENCAGIFGEFLETEARSSPFVNENFRASTLHRPQTTGI
jgi:L-methionine (R)-S-oxide reductase